MDPSAFQNAINEQRRKRSLTPFQSAIEDIRLKRREAQLPGGEEETASATAKQLGAGAGALAVELAMSPFQGLSGPVVTELAMTKTIKPERLGQLAELSAQQTADRSAAGIVSQLAYGAVTSLASDIASTARGVSMVTAPYTPVEAFARGAQQTAQSRLDTVPTNISNALTQGVTSMALMAGTSAAGVPAAAPAAMFARSLGAQAQAYEQEFLSGTMGQNLSQADRYMAAGLGAAVEAGIEYGGGRMIMGAAKKLVGRFAAGQIKNPVYSFVRTAAGGAAVEGTEEALTTGITEQGVTRLTKQETPTVGSTLGQATVDFMYGAIGGVGGTVTAMPFAAAERKAVERKVDEVLRKSQTEFASPEFLERATGGRVRSMVSMTPDERIAEVEQQREAALSARGTYATAATMHQNLLEQRKNQSDALKKAQRRKDAAGIKTAEDAIADLTSKIDTSEQGLILLAADAKSAEAGYFASAAFLARNSDPVQLSVDDVLRQNNAATASASTDADRAVESELKNLGYEVQFYTGPNKDQVGFYDPAAPNTIFVQSGQTNAAEAIGIGYEEGVHGIQYSDAALWQAIRQMHSPRAAIDAAVQYFTQRTNPEDIAARSAIDALSNPQRGAVDARSAVANRFGSTLVTAEGVANDIRDGVQTLFRTGQAPGLLGRVITRMGLRGRQAATALRVRNLMMERASTRQRGGISEFGRQIQEAKGGIQAMSAFEQEVARRAAAPAPAPAPAPVSAPAAAPSPAAPSPAAPATAPAPGMLFARARRESDIGHKREKTTGRYVGAPDWVGGDPAKLRVLRNKLRQLAKEGEVGKYWYEKSSRAILDAVGGDIVEAEKLVALIAIYSPNATVAANMTMAMTAYYQFKAGLPIEAGLGASNRKAEDLLKNNKRWDGIKTNSFYQNLMVDIDPSYLDTNVATMDMWMALAFDYGDKVLDQGPKYRFSEREIQRLAVELGWKPHQVQAAIWTAMKGRIDPIRDALKQEEVRVGIGEFVEEVDKKTGKNKIVYKVKKDRERDHFKLAHEMGMRGKANTAALAESKYDFGDALNDRMVQLSWEATPSTAANAPLPGIHNAPLAQKIEYLTDISDVLSPNGRDIIADMVGLPQGQTIIGISAWKAAIGAGAQTFYAVPMEGAGGKRQIKDVANDMLRLASAIRGYVLTQDMVVYHTPVFDSSVKSQNGVQLLTQRSLTPDEMQTLYNALNAKFGTWDLAPGYLPQGARILNFVEGLDNKKFHDGVREILTALPDDFGGGNIEFGKYRSAGDAVFSDWKDNPNGEIYREIIAARSPDLLRRADDLRASVEAVNRRFADKYGWDKPTAAAAAAAPAASEQVSAEQEQSNRALAARQRAVANAPASAIQTQPLPAAFYSALNRAIDAAPDKSMKPDSWRQLITSMVNKGQVKSEEVFWSGLQQFIDLLDPNVAVSKAQIRESLGAGGVSIRLVQLDDPLDDVFQNNRSAYLPPGYQITFVEEDEGYFEVRDAAGQVASSDENDAVAVQTAWESYNADERAAGRTPVKPTVGLALYGPSRFPTQTLRGGKDYREMVMLFDRRPTPEVTDEDVKNSGLSVLSVEYVGNTTRFTIVRNLPSSKQGVVRTETVDFATVGGQWTKDYILKQYLTNQRRSAAGAPFAESHHEGVAEVAGSEVLLHYRVTTRVVDGKRYLFIEELQSDYGQKGRARGFKQPGETGATQEQIQQARARAKNVLRDYILNPDEYEETKNVLVRFWKERDSNDVFLKKLEKQYARTREGLNPVENRQLIASWADAYRSLKDVMTAANVDRIGVSRGPMVTSTDAWVTLGLKQILMQAVNEGYDGVAFINGRQEAKRNQQIYKVPSITYRDLGDGLYDAITADADVNIGTIEDIKDEFGSTVADMIKRGEGVRAEGSDLTTIDTSEMTFGTEAMEGFYEGIVPKNLKKLISKLGGPELGTITLSELDNRPSIRESEDVDGATLYTVVRPSDTGFGNSLTTYRTFEAAQRRLDEIQKTFVGQPSPKQIALEITDALETNVRKGLALFARSREQRQESLAFAMGRRSGQVAGMMKGREQGLREGKEEQRRKDVVRRREMRAKFAERVAGFEQRIENAAQTNTDLRQRLKDMRAAGVEQRADLMERARVRVLKAWFAGQQKGSNAGYEQAKKDMVAMRKDALAIIKLLPPSMRGAYGNALATMKTVAGIDRISRRVVQDLVTADAIDMVNAINRMDRRARKVGLRTDTRDEIIDMLNTARGMLASGRNRLLPFTNTSDLSGRINAANDLLAQAVAMFEDERAEYRMERDARAAEFEQDASDLSATLAGKKGLPPERLASQAPRRGVFGQLFSNNANMDMYTIMERLEGSASGVLNKLWSGLIAGKNAMLKDRRDLDTRIDQALRRAGYDGYDGYATRAAGLYGDATAETVEVKIGGEMRRITVDQMMHLAALDNDTVELLMDENDPETRSSPIVFATYRYEQPIYLTKQEHAALVAGLTPRQTALISELKAILEGSVQPRVFEIHFQQQGKQPPRVEGYFPRSRLSDEVGGEVVDPNMQPGQVLNTMLTNAGFLQKRVRSSAPLVIGGMMRTFDGHIDEALRLIHLAIPLRHAMTVLRRRGVRSNIERIMGRGSNDAVRMLVLNGVGLSGKPQGDLVEMVNSNISGALLLINPKTWLRQLGGAFRLVTEFDADAWATGLAASLTLTPSQRAQQIQQIESTNGYFYERHRRSQVGLFANVLGDPRTGREQFANGMRAVGRALATAGEDAAAGRWLQAANDVRQGVTGVGRIMRAVDFALRGVDRQIMLVAYNAALAQLRQTNPSMPNIEDAAAALAERSFRRTQNVSDPMDDTMYSAQQKFSRGIGRLMFPFSSDPLKAYNQMRRAYASGDATRIAKATAGVGTNILAGAAVNPLWAAAGLAIASAFNSGDDDEVIAEMLREKETNAAARRIASDVMATAFGNAGMLASGIIEAAVGDPRMAEDVGEPLAIRALGDLATATATGQFGRAGGIAAQMVGVPVVAPLSAITSTAAAVRPSDEKLLTEYRKRRKAGTLTPQQARRMRVLEASERLRKLREQSTQ
jgi:hypothetical protein